MGLLQDNATITVAINGITATVELVQIFTNRTDAPIEANFRFPVPSGSAITNFEACIDGKFIKGELKEKEGAFDKYDDAIASGNAAYMASQDSGSFSLLLGNIPPQKIVNTKLTWIESLQPHTRMTNGVSAVDPLYAQYTLKALKTIPRNGYTINPVEIHMGSDIVDIYSPTHKITVDRDGTKKAIVKVEYDSKQKLDFVLATSLSKPMLNKANIEKSSSRDKSYKHAVQIPITTTAFPLSSSASEIIFVIDCSGSMSGTPIQAAKRAMNLFLQSLPENCYINIYRFGTKFETLFTAPTLLTDGVLEAARTYTHQTDATLGGTELLEPMQAIFRYKSDKRRNIFVLTDGQVSNEGACIKVVEDNNKNNVVFTFGLGSGVSKSLVGGMAKAGNGTVEFSDTNDKLLQAKIIGQLKIALKVPIKEITWKWSESFDFLPASPSFEYNELSSYTLSAFIGALPEKPFTLSLISTTTGHCIGTATIDPSQYTEGDSFHKIVAAYRISLLEEDKVNNKNEILKLSQDFGVLSNSTAFVLVEKQDIPTWYSMEEHTEQLAEVAKSLLEPLPKQFMAELSRAEEEMLIDQERAEIEASKEYLQELDATDPIEQNEEYVTIVLEIGSEVTKGGYSRRYPVTSVSVVGRPRHRGVMVGMGQKDSYVGGSPDAAKLSSKQPDAVSNSSGGGSGSGPTVSASGSSASIFVDENGTMNFPQEVMDGILFAQSVSGAWKCTESVALKIKMELKKIVDAAPDKNSLDEWMTAIVIAFLEEHFSQKRTEWELIVNKAKNYLTNKNKMEYCELAKTFVLNK